MNPNQVNVLALAYLGDAIYEVAVREHVIKTIKSGHADLMHKEGVRFVCAGAQANAVRLLIDQGFFDEEELAILKRARNHRTATKPKNADVMEYKWATAFEALVGWLNLSGKTERQNQLIEKTIEILK